MLTYISMYLVSGLVSGFTVRNFGEAVGNAGAVAIASLLGAGESGRHFLQSTFPALLSLPRFFILQAPVTSQVCKAILFPVFTH